MKTLLLQVGQTWIAESPDFPDLEYKIELVAKVWRVEKWWFIGVKYLNDAKPRGNISNLVIAFNEKGVGFQGFSDDIEYKLVRKL